MTETTFIYGLSDPLTGECRYIGKTDRPTRRLKKHLSRSKKPRTHRENWIAGLLSLGLEPVIEVIDEVPVSQWQFWEREYIRVFKAIGIRLTNATEGGEAGPGAPKGSPGPMKGKRHSEETKQRIGAAQLGRRRSEETRKKQSAAASGRKFSAEHRKNISDAKRGCKGHNLGKKFSEETCRKISESKKAAFAARKA